MSGTSSFFDSAFGAFGLFAAMVPLARSVPRLLGLFYGVFHNGSRFSGFRSHAWTGQRLGGAGAILRVFTVPKPVWQSQIETFHSRYSYSSLFNFKTNQQCLPSIPLRPDLSGRPLFLEGSQWEKNHRHRDRSPRLAPREGSPPCRSTAAVYH